MKVFFYSRNLKKENNNLASKYTFIHLKAFVVKEEDSLPRGH
jgi:hypothetical protein